MTKSRFALRKLQPTQYDSNHESLELLAGVIRCHRSGHLSNPTSAAIQFIHFGNRDNHGSTPSGPGEPASYLVSQAHLSGVRARLSPVVVLQLWLLAPPRGDTAARDREPGRARLVGTRPDLASALLAPFVPAAAT